jgi:3-deoxy-D-manno-octulosonate 8-phosphate phosphatase (KDO 8-P phosphatase)
MNAQTVGITDTELKTILGNIRLVVFDFDGVFTDNMVYVFEDGREAVRCSRFDGIGLSKLAARGIAAAIISKEVNPVVSARARKLGIRCIQRCDDKKAAITELMSELNVELPEVAFVGNDINDIPCLTIVGLPIIVNDAHEDVHGYALYKTARRGGDGAVREVCDLIDDVYADSY